MSWTATINLQSQGIRRVRVSYKGRLMTFAEVITAWKRDLSFSRYFSSLLMSSPFEAFFWETPAVNVDMLDRVFEYVEVESEMLASMSLNPEAFSEHFQAADTDVTSFSNIGGDAMLVVPCQVMMRLDYRHLKVFLQNAPVEQIEALWRKLGDTVENIIGSDPVWISTAGTGVAWLHIRLDSFPKYYTYKPYCQF